MDLLKSLVNLASRKTLLQIVYLGQSRLKKDFVGKLPVEIAIQILVHLPTKELFENCLRVSRRWAAVLSGREGELGIWKKILVSEKWADEEEVHIHQILTFL